MAVSTVFRHMSKSRNFNSTFLLEKIRKFSSLHTPSCPRPCTNPLQVRPISSPAETLAGFGEMVSRAEQKCYMLSKKGAIGETSCLASLAVKFATHSNPPNVVSTCPVHSLSNSFDHYLSGTALVPVQGMQSPLFPLEINSEENFLSAIQKTGGNDVEDFTDSMGLGLLSQQLEELDLEELLVTPLGLDKAIAISNACYTAPRLSIDAVYRYTYFSQSSSKAIQCGPKKIKFAKQRRGRMGGIAHRGNHICFGRFALQALEPGWITSQQIESGRRALARNLGRGVKIWVRVFPDKPVTARPAETRMGRGKGNVAFWVAVVQPGRILYEMGGTSESLARKAISVAASKLPMRTRFIALDQGING